jgi:hypothetical protein
MLWEAATLHAHAASVLGSGAMQQLQRQDAKQMCMSQCLLYDELPAC